MKVIEKHRLRCVLSDSACEVVGPVTCTDRNPFQAIPAAVRWLMMSESHCPICYAPLEVRDVTPCWDCGANPAEIDHLAHGRHTYAEVRIYGAGIVLCDFCQVDFGSYAAEYFGQGRRALLGQGITFVREIRESKVSKDKYCAVCGRRLAFLRFLANVRERGSENQIV